MRLELRIEPLLDQARQAFDVVGIGQVRDIEPRIGAGQVGKLDHHLGRHAGLVAPGVVPDVRAVRPPREVRIVGAHPVHEAERAHVLDELDEARVEGLAGLEAREVGRVHHRDVANVVAVRAGLEDVDREQVGSRWREVEPDLTVAVADVARALHDDLALAVVAQAVAPGHRGHGGRQLGQHQGGDVGHAGREAGRPAVRVEIAARGQLRRVDAAPLPRKVPGPRTRGLEDVDEGLLAAPVGHPAQADADRWVFHGVLCKRTEQ